MRLAVGAWLSTLILLSAVVPAAAYNCPVQIKYAEDLIKKAEAGKLTPETKALLAEARKLVAEAKAHHEQAKDKKDHADSVRKAKFAQALAEEVLYLQLP